MLVQSVYDELRLLILAESPGDMYLIYYTDLDLQPKSKLFSVCETLLVCANV